MGYTSLYVVDDGLFDRLRAARIEVHSEEGASEKIFLDKALAKKKSLPKNDQDLIERLEMQRSRIVQNIAIERLSEDPRLKYRELEAQLEPLREAARQSDAQIRELADEQQHIIIPYLGKASNRSASSKEGFVSKKFLEGLTPAEQSKYANFGDELERLREATRQSDAQIRELADEQQRILDNNPPTKRTLESSLVIFRRQPVR